MILTKEETQKALLAENVGELGKVLDNLEHLGDWNGKEPLSEHYSCIFGALQKLSDTQKEYCCQRQLSLHANDDGTIRAEFEGELNDEELENVSGSGCDFGNFSGSGRGPFLKPVVYLYPETETEVSVRIRDDRLNFTCVYPAFNWSGSWLVNAAPDGTLICGGKKYNYLYWEGDGKTEWYDMSRGFCVAGNETAQFLETALAKLGLNEREANEFIVYWLPRMQSNAYNLISFQGQTYESAAPMEVSPAPDTVIRVFMAFRPLKKAVEIEPQTLAAPERRGFTVVEWGGGVAGCKSKTIE